jgi:hypothetical protein
MPAIHELSRSQGIMPRHAATAIVRPRIG